MRRRDVVGVAAAAATVAILTTAAAATCGDAGLWSVFPLTADAAVVQVVGVGNAGDGN